MITVGEAVEIKSIPVKDFSFEKGRCRLLNWYIQNIQDQQRSYEKQSDDTSIANYNIYFRDPEEGNKTHAYLQLEGLIQLDKSQQSVNITYMIHIDVVNMYTTGGMCWRYIEIFRETRRRSARSNTTTNNVKNVYEV